MIAEREQPRAKAFFSMKYLEAAKKAQKFAGADGRLATIPDIIDARLGSELVDPAWEQYFTTNSAEYFGFTRQNNPLIIVAHGVGPLSNPESVHDIYNADSKAPGSWGGRITRQEFWDLESGKFGDVSVVDFWDYSRGKQYPLLDSITSWDAISDPVVAARLGNRSREYIARHTHEALNWAQIRDEQVKKGELEIYGMKITRLTGGDKYKIITMSDPSNNRYEHRRKEEPPLAHMLTIEQLMTLNLRSLHSEIYCSENSEIGRVVGIKGNEPITSIDSKPVRFPKKLLQESAV